MDKITEEAYKILLDAYNSRSEEAEKRAELYDQMEQSLDFCANVIIDTVPKLAEKGITLSVETTKGKPFVLDIADAALKAIDELPENDPLHEERNGIYLTRLYYYVFRGNGYTDKAAVSELLQLLGINKNQEVKKHEANPAEEKEVQEEAAKRITAVVPKMVQYPLDKINANVWALLDEAGDDGQLTMLPFATEKRGSKKEATVYFSLDFDTIAQEMGIKPHLDQFDKRAYIAVASMMGAQGEFMSVEQIWRTMGNTSRPNTKQIEKLNNSLTKMRKAQIFIDNKEELQTNKGYVRFKYDGSLLPFERTSAYINGKLCNSVIHLFREPPLMSFARERKQITSIPVKLLESPINKTDDMLRLEDYLLDRISHMKSGNLSNKILYATIFKKCGINGTSSTDRSKKSRMQKDAIPRLLKYYKDSHFIKDYKEAADGITIKL